ncbi:hypothetical protein [Pseudonocardia sp. HH130629-09]|uniref:hypothetical protein n=1 Tax=Pseudonocardia sp. HH130629-09 TaxID=1641402 RepID=UPI000A55E80E|nr:hypothetical protein [Pseudonocardia sp. HH130629-09]
MYELSQRWQDWPTATCVVDGREEAMSYQRYAWGWAGFVHAVGVAGVQLVGVGIEPETVRLETVRDPQKYGLDPSRRLSVSDLYDERENLPVEARLPLPWANTMHDDHRALIEKHGLG